MSGKIVERTESGRISKRTEPGKLTERTEYGKITEGQSMESEEQSLERPRV